MAGDTFDKKAGFSRFRNAAPLVSLWIALICLLSAAKSARTCSIGSVRLPENCRILEVESFFYSGNVTVVLLCVSMLILTLTIALQLGAAEEDYRPTPDMPWTDTPNRAKPHGRAVRREDWEEAISLMRRASVLLDDAGNSVAACQVEHAISVAFVDELAERDGALSVGR